MESVFEFEKRATDCEKACQYMIDVWDEVRPGWRDRPDHVMQKFIAAESEIIRKRKALPEPPKEETK